MVRWRPMSIWYEVNRGTGELIVHLAGRSQDGKRIKVQLLGTKPYFFAPAGEARVEDPVTEIEHSACRTLAGPWGPSISVDKIYVRYPFDVPRIRETFSQHFEADVTYERRVRFDLGIRDCIETPDGQTVIWPQDIKPSPGPTIEPRICNLDIETFDGLEAKNPQAPVVAVALWDSKTDLYSGLYSGQLPMPEEVTAWFTKKGLKGKVHILSDERGLFGAFTKYISAASPDLLTGWNYIGFDFEYLKNRAEQKGFPAPNWKEYENFDCMEAYSFIVHQRSGNWQGLDEVAREEGFEGKTTSKRIRQMIEEGIPHELVQYNINDVYQCVQIMKKRKLVSFFARLAALAGCSIGDIFNGTDISLGRLAESFVMHRSNGVWALPSKDKERAAQYWYPVQGAFALPPVAGIHAPIVEADNSTEYVSTVRTFNISPDTLVRDDYDGPCFTMPSGRRYRKEPRGFLPSCLDELAKLREDTKQDIKKGVPGSEEQDAVAKSVSNTTAYGWPSSPMGRISDPDCANDITDVPRHHLRHNAEFIMNWEREVSEGGVIKGNEVLGGFTDGTFYKPYPGHDPQVMIDALNKSLDGFAAQFGADKHYFAVKLEHYNKELKHSYVSGLIRAHDGNTRGSYAMVYEDDGKGPTKDVFERHGKKYRMKIRGFEERRGDAAPVTKVLQKEVLFRAAMGEDVTQYLRETIDRMRKGEIPHDQVGIAKRISKDDYGKSVPQHVRAARWSNQHLGTNFTVGSKPLVLLASVPGLPSTDVIAVERGAPLPVQISMNWERVIERTIIGPLQEVLDILSIPKQALMANTAEATDFW